MKFIPGHKYKLLQHYTVSQTTWNPGAIFTHTCLLGTLSIGRELHQFKCPDGDLHGFVESSRYFRPVIEVGMKLRPINTALNSKAEYGIDDIKPALVTVRWDLALNSRQQIWGSIWYTELDLWNWYEIWDEQGPGPNTSKRCEHKIVNVSFMQLDLRCKFCDKSEDEIQAESNPSVSYEGLP